MRKLFPMLLGIAGLLAGGATGLALRPEPVPMKHAAASPGASAGKTSKAATGKQEAAAGKAKAPSDGAEGAPSKKDYIKLNNQFIVPLVRGGHVDALVILSLSLEVEPGAGPQIYAIEPKMRDVFLQVLFNHANIGGFEGNFTASDKMQLLRDALLESAKRLLDTTVSDVLISDIVRQDA